MPLQRVSTLATERSKVDAIQQIAGALGSTLDLDALLHLIVDKITVLMKAERSTLYLLDRASRQLWTKVIQADEVREIKLNPGQGVAGWVAENGRSANITDAYADSRFAPDVDQKTGYRTRSILCVPFRDNKGEMVGVVQVLNKQAGLHFSEEDEELLGALVGQASVAVQNGQLYAAVVEKNRVLRDTQRELERRVRELDLLLNLEQHIHGFAEVEELLESLLPRVANLVGARAAAVLLCGGTNLVGYAGDAGPVPSFVSVTLPVDAIPQDDLRGTTAHRVDDLQSCWDAERRLVGALGLPLEGLVRAPFPRTQSVPSGYIEFVNPDRAHGPGSDHVRLAQIIAGRIAHAIETARVLEQRSKERRLTAIGTMLSGLVHDLRAPMTIISGYTQLVAEGTDEERQEYAGRVMHQLDLMSGMIGEVLAFARGETTLLVRKVYLHRFVKDISESLRHEFAGTGVELTVEDNYRGIAYFDEAKLRRVFHNLARNAAQAMRGSGQFRISVDSVEQSLVLTFSDTGPGIPAQMRGRLFELFASAGKSQGTGLGLAIVKRIVDEHGGRIECESEPGKGTAFRVTLPLKRRPARPTSSTSQRACGPDSDSAAPGAMSDARGGI